MLRLYALNNICGRVKVLNFTLDTLSNIYKRSVLHLIPMNRYIDLFKYRMNGFRIKGNTFCYSIHRLFATSSIALENNSIQNKWIRWTNCSLWKSYAFSTHSKMSCSIWIDLASQLLLNDEWNSNFLQFLKTYDEFVSEQYALNLLLSLFRFISIVSFGFGMLWSFGRFWFCCVYRGFSIAASANRGTWNACARSTPLSHERTKRNEIHIWWCIVACMESELLNSTTAHFIAIDTLANTNAQTHTQITYKHTPKFVYSHTSERNPSIIGMHCTIFHVCVCVRALLSLPILPCVWVLVWM